MMTSRRGIRNERPPLGRGPCGFVLAESGRHRAISPEAAQAHWQRRAAFDCADAITDDRLGAELAARDEFAADAQLDLAIGANPVRGWRIAQNAGAALTREQQQEPNMSQSTALWQAGLAIGWGFSATDAKGLLLAMQARGAQFKMRRAPK